MLIAFHLLHIIISYVIRNTVKKRNIFVQNLTTATFEVKQVDEKSKSYDAENDLTFDPPVYRQRYGTVFDVLLDARWRKDIKKLVDFGCAEFGLFVFIKRLTALQQILFIDVDEDLLTHYKTKLYPLTIEYLKQRSEPFNVSILQGSVADPDGRLDKTDAITAIELIEHLYPDVLDAFPYNIFDHIHPKIAIITTPNADFNVLFKNFHGFRHDDHKFEWTRQQFEDWARNVVVRFPDYTVTFSGIGEGPEGTETFGCCSQMAVFLRNDLLYPNYKSSGHLEACNCDLKSSCKGVCSCICATCSPEASVGVCTHCSRSATVNIGQTDDDFYYKLIESIDYPFQRDDRSDEQRMIDEFRYRINNFGHINGRFYNDDTNRAEIPLETLIYGPQGAFITLTELNDLLNKFGYVTKECVLPETGQSELCVLYEPEMEKISPSDSEASDWDVVYVPADVKKDDNAKETSQEATANPTDDEQRQQEALFDSGYQKSSSILDDSPQTPTEDFDVFEDPTAEMPPQPPKALLPNDNKLKVDIHRINELDSFANQNQYVHVSPTKTFFPGHLFKPPLEAIRKQFLKEVKDALPGPSNVKKRKKLVKKTSPLDESDEDSSLEDVKSIAKCLLENTLNKIDVGEPEAELIEELDAADEHLEVPGPVVVENGDLANNNRDLEGNNYMALLQGDDNIDIANDNLDVAVVVDEQVEENANFHNEEPLQPEIIVEQPAQPPQDVVDEAVAVEQASREALFDPNSQQDLLDDFELPSAHIQDDVQEQQNNYFVVGVHFLPEDADAVMTNNPDGFPDWLLQILGAHVTIGEGAESHDEPHFYCQGDGLGVHPSIIAVDIDDEDASTNSSSSSSSTAQSSTLEEMNVVVTATEQPGLERPAGAAGPTSSEEVVEEFFDTVAEGSNTGPINSAADSGD